MPQPQTIAGDRLDRLEVTPKKPETADPQVAAPPPDFVPTSRLTAAPENPASFISPPVGSPEASGSSVQSAGIQAASAQSSSVQPPSIQFSSVQSASVQSPSVTAPQPAPSSALAPSPQMEIVTQRSLSAPVPPSPPPVPSARVVSQSVQSPRPVSPYPSANKATITVQPFAVQQDVFKEPSLPRLKQVQLNPHRHSHNPLFPLSLLQDIAAIVEDWQAQLENLHQQVQALYLDGPIVDGWLEAEATLDGVIQGYRLCGLDDQGQMWARPCPPDQLPGVSTAIARYQHLRQLLAQKQALEVRFQQLGETLAMVRGNL